ncbi:MAG: enoyl-CoA hydratase/isomerase family protein [Bacteroidales bacterium]|nr:enoyl-CoA hydratase/isomerase family protein [Bacteroidales bacterium]
MEYEILKLDVDQGIATITIHRPQVLNALNSQFFVEMNHTLDLLEKDLSIKVVILTGVDKAFVAGADIAEMSEMDYNHARSFSLTGQDTFQRIENFPIPVIAAVNGFALGGGCELAMACDFRIASNKAKFSQPEVSLGLIPGYAGTQRLSRIAGISNALFMIVTGDMITADDALRMGLVQKVTEPEELLPEAKALAGRIASKGSLAVKKAKEVIRKGIQMDFDAACRYEADQFALLFGNGESGEGMTAFLEKRKPNW